MTKEKIKYMGSTKKQIWDAYNEALEMLNKQPSPMSTTEAAKKKDVKKALEKAESLDIVALSTSLEILINDISTAATEFGQLQTAIKTKKEELKEIHEIESAANSAAAFAIAQEELIKKRDEYLSAREEEFNKQIGERKKLEERRVEDWEYQFKIEQRDREDALNRTLNARIEAVELREKAINDAEEEIKKLKTDISILEYDFDKKVEAKVAEVKKEAEKSAAISRQILENKHQSEMAIKDEINNSLKIKVSDLSRVVEQQKDQISQMQTQINNMAIAALKAQGDAATINKVAEVVASGGNKK